MNRHQHHSAPGSPSGSSLYNVRDASRRDDEQGNTETMKGGGRRNSRQYQRRGRKRNTARGEITQFPGAEFKTNYNQNCVSGPQNNGMNMFQYTMGYPGANGYAPMMMGIPSESGDAQPAPLYMAQSFVPMPWESYAQHIGRANFQPYPPNLGVQMYEPKFVMHGGRSGVRAGRYKNTSNKNTNIGKQGEDGERSQEGMAPRWSDSRNSVDKGPCSVAHVSTLGNLWTSSALPAIEDRKDDAPDMERFLRAATPRFKISSDPGSLRDLKLIDVWKFFEKSSAFGMKCSTLGGPRGPSTSYFVPFLSSVQIYDRVDKLPEDPKLLKGLLSFPEGLEAWPSYMKKSFSWHAKDHIAERSPLYLQVMDLCGSAGLEHPLSASRISDLHPYSWFAVAWYPLYRIPEAPLTARFLTFHSIAPIWEAVAQSIVDRTNISAMHSQISAKIGEEGEKAPNSVVSASVTPKAISSFPGSPLMSGTHTPAGSAGSHSTDPPMNTSDTASVTASYGSSGPPSPENSGDEDEEDDKPFSCAATTISSSTSLSRLELPPVGLCWHTVGNNSGNRRLPPENWVDTMVKVTTADGTGLSSGDSLPGPTNACVVSVSAGCVVVKKDYPLSKGGPLSWEIQQEELAEGAKRLALGMGIMSAGDDETLSGGPPEDTCPDYKFFVSRS